MAEIVVSPRAGRDLEDIWLAVSAHNPRAANSLLKRFSAKIETLRNMPSLGSPRPDLAPSARLLVEGSYVVLYQHRKGVVRIVAIVHGARDLPNIF